MITNKTIEDILNHKSIRKWKDKKISNDILTTLFEVANRTSTSNGLQQASIIRITDAKLKEKISELANQKYLVDVPELLVFIADNHRNYKILEEKNITPNHAADGDRLFQAITDSCIMAQNIAVAAESLGLGIVYFGSIINKNRELIKLLNLPKYTLPVVGLGIGYPDQEPQLKPRMNLKTRIFENEYTVFENYHEELLDYDEKIQEYYDLRNENQRVDSFTNQVKSKLDKQYFTRSEIFEIAKEQGYNI